MEFNEWLEEWLEYKIKPSTKVRTYEKYRAGISRYIAPALGGYALEELNTMKLQKFAVSLSDVGLAPSTVNCLISILKHSLRSAVAYGITDKQYSDGLTRPKRIEKQIECFTKEEQKILEEYIFTHEKYNLYGILIALYTGVRIGELLALTWQDFDFDKMLLSVNKSCYDKWEEGAYSKIIETPKTRSSSRLIPIPVQLSGLLIELKGLRRSRYAVSGRSEHGAEIRSYQRTFCLLLSKLGLKHRGFHALRHTFATRALECGMDVKTLAEIMGHKNPNITLTRYAHSLIEHKREMMNKVGSLLV